MTHEKRMIKSCRETIDAVKEEFHVLNKMHSDDHYFCSILFLHFAHSESQVLCKSRHKGCGKLWQKVPSSKLYFLILDLHIQPELLLTSV